MCKEKPKYLAEIDRHLFLVPIFSNNLNMYFNLLIWAISLYFYRNVQPHLYCYPNLFLFAIISYRKAYSDEGAFNLPAGGI